MRRWCSWRLPVAFSWASLIEVLRLSSVILLMHVLKKLSHDRHEIWLRVKVCPVDSPSKLLSFVLLEVSNINFLLNVDLSDFFDLVVVDEELLSLKNLLMKIEFGTHSRIGIFETNKSKVDAVCTFICSDAFDFTELFKNLADFELAPSWRNVFDVEVAAFLCFFEAHSLCAFLLFSVSFLESVSDVQLVVSHLVLVELTDDSLGTLRTVLLVQAFGVVVADKAELP